MANNRLYLLHRPSSIAICLGKRMAFGWYNPPEAAELRRFYDETLEYSNNQSQDDFVLTDEADDIWDEVFIDKDTGFIRLKKRTL